MYFITTLNQDDARCVGYYSDLNKAIKAIKENYYDLYEEGYYPYAVIENVREGIYQYDHSPMWFTYDKKEKRYKKSDRPSFIASNVIGHGIG